MKGKKLLSILLAFVLVLSMFPVLTASAGWTKNIYVCGVQVKDTNHEDILGDGRFSYIDYEKTLYVKGDVVGYEGDIIKSDSQNLKIQPVGKRTLSCTGYALTVTDNTILTNGGDTGNTLALTTTGTGPAVGVGANVTLTLDSANVSALGGKAGFAGPTLGENNAKLVIKNSSVHASGDEAAIYFFKGGIELVDCAIDTVGLRVEGHEIVKADGNTATTVDFKPIKTYDIWVCGTQVTEKNADDVLGDGACKFQVADSYLFVFKDISYEGAEAAVESKLGKELNLCLKADATIENTGKGNAVYSNDGLKISGDGKLTATAAGSDATALKADGTITIAADMNVTAEGGAYGVYGKKIVIETATVAAKGSTNAIRASEEGLHLSAEIGVAQPVGGQIAGSEIRDKEGAPATEVLLEPVVNYDLYICGKQVNTANKDDVLGDGAFLYNPDTRILVIKGDCEYMGNIIESSIEDLAINIANEPTLKAIDGNAIVLYKDAQFGQGKLTLRGLNGIFVEDCTATFFWSYIDASGTGSGIRGGSGSPALDISASSITATGSEEAIAGMASIKLTAAYIKTPEGGELKDGKTIVDKDGNAAKVVEIGSYGPALKWDVIFNVNGHGTAPAAQVVDAGKPATKPEDPTEEGWKFEGWFTEAECTTAYDFAEPVNTDLTLFAKWTKVEGTEPAKTFTVTYDTNGHGTAPEAEKVEDGKTATKPADPTEEGWKFEGWFTEAECTTEYDFAAAVTADLTLFAKWTKDEGTEPAKPCDGGPSCPSYKFTDVNAGDWFHEAVDFAVSKGLFNGMSDTTFEPNTPMSRAMLVTVLWRYEGKPMEGKNEFTDVPAGQWYTDAVAWAASKGIVNGVGAGKFDPDGKITREQLAAILFRYSGNKGYDVSKRGDFTAFPDKDKVSDWAKDAYGWAVAEGLITGNVIGGNTLLDPQGNATRAQVATILMRFINGIAK